nr:MAG TPA: hypothetical protein [Caudoviricetes sp.]
MSKQIREGDPAWSSRPGHATAPQRRGGPSRYARRSSTRHWLPSNPRARRDTTDRLRLAPAKSRPLPRGGGRSPPSLTNFTNEERPTDRTG